MKLLRAWLPLILLAVVVGGGVWYVNKLRNEGNEAAQDRDRLALELAGASAVHEVTAKVLRAEVTRLTDTAAGLQAEIDKVRGAMPGAKPVAVASGGTGGIVVGPAAGIPVATPLATSGTAPPSAPTCPACALRVGDQVELKVYGVALQGDSGAVAVAATAQAWRVGDPPTLLAEGPLHLKVQMKDPGELPGWGAGAVVVGGRGGWFWVRYCRHLRSGCGALRGRCSSAPGSGRGRVGRPRRGPAALVDAPSRPSDGPGVG